LEDQETSFQTSQAVPLVALVAVRLEQAIRGDINSIASTNRILNSPKSISSGLGLDFSDGVGPDFEVHAGQNNNGDDRHCKIAPHGRE